MRLINADYLRSTYSITHAHFDSIESIRQWIDKVPTVDAEPVRHGRWIDKSGGIEGAWNHCSVCGERAIDLYDYCPNCGAKMDEEEP